MWRSPPLGTTGGGGGTHGYIWLVLVRLGQSVEDELFVVAGVYFRDHRGCLLYFRLLRSPCGWTQKLVLRMSSVTQREAPGSDTPGLRHFYTCHHSGPEALWTRSRQHPRQDEQRQTRHQQPKPQRDHKPGSRNSCEAGHINSLVTEPRDMPGNSFGLVCRSRTLQRCWAYTGALLEHVPPWAAAISQMVGSCSVLVCSPSR